MPVDCTLIWLDGYVDVVQWGRQNQYTQFTVTMCRQHDYGCEWWGTGFTWTQVYSTIPNTVMDDNDPYKVYTL